MDLNLHTIDRSIYGFLDFLGDIGGLAGSLHALAGVVAGLMMYQAAYNSLSDDLYSYKSFKKDQAKQADSAIRVETEKTEK